MHNTRVERDGEVQYATDIVADVKHIAYRWTQRIDETLEGRIIELMREVTAGAPIIGFGTAIADDEAKAYIKELRENLAAEKCRLLTIYSSERELIGLCTLKRNLNPNNRHITDLAKGMIAEKYRGGMVLPAAFHEIAIRCEQDGVEVVTLDVRADTPAHRVWQKFGFRSYGVLDDYARVNGQVFAGHFMMQKVSELKDRAIGILWPQAEQRAAANG
ncbi:MAG TPA: GNAT family N-acetyltransferase [Paucimonas sp.]|nr:GNAT family N-acetyltransferase [Paucimonas sp.]